MKVSFSKPLSALDSVEGVIAVLVAKDDKTAVPGAGAQAIDAATSGALSRAMAGARFDGAAGKTLTLWAPAGLKATRVVALGLGEAAKIDARAAEKAGGGLVKALGAGAETEATALIDAPDGCALALDALAARVGYGARLTTYRFDPYHTKLKDDEKPSLKSLTLAVKGKSAAKNAYAPLSAIADGVFFTRDLVNEPGNVLFPAEFAKRLKKLSSLGVEVEVLGEKEMEKLGMGSLLGVGQGSVRDSQLVVMNWKGGGAKDKPVAFVGKGVCFDTGGISLKPGPGMEEMTMDMGGAGVVSGLMMALAGRKAKVNAVGVVGLVENMPDGNAQRPGDIVTSMSGQTIEILNTDAEGRLVLADALWYTQDRFKPRFMVDLATLTGAIIIALGHEHAGLFSNDDALSEQLTAAGLAEDEKLWRLPLNDAYDRKLKSRLADMQNIGGRDAGSITAAQFLQRFVNDTPWAHLDIAGVTLLKEALPTAPKGATGFGVRLLDRLVADHYEA